MAISKATKTWLRGIIGAAINGMSSSVTAAIVAPEQFNPFDPHSGWMKIFWRKNIRLRKNTSRLLKIGSLTREANWNSKI